MLMENVDIGQRTERIKDVTGKSAAMLHQAVSVDERLLVLVNSLGFLRGKGEFFAILTLMEASKLTPGILFHDFLLTRNEQALKCLSDICLAY